MRGALTVSIGFHLLIAVLMWVGLPRLDRSPPAVERLKIIEMVDIAAITNAPAKAAPRPEKPARRQNLSPPNRRRRRQPSRRRRQ